MTLVGAEKFPAIFAHGGKPGCVRFFGRGERTEVNALAVDSYPSNKSRFLISLLHAARKVSPVSACRVPAVLLPCRDSQVLQSIVCSIAVLVIHFCYRPFASVHRPNDMMNSASKFVVEDQSYIACPMHASGNFASVTTIPDTVPSIRPKVSTRSSLPRQQTALRIIRETLAQILCARQPSFHRGIVP